MMQAIAFALEAIGVLSLVGAAYFTIKAFRNFNPPQFLPTDGEQGFVSDPAEPSFEDDDANGHAWLVQRQVAHGGER